MSNRLFGLGRRALPFLFVALLVCFRIAVVRTYHAPAGDGVQYYRIAQELKRAGRYAFGPQAPLSYARLPGYPWFLRTAVLPAKAVPLAEHVAVAAYWNVLFDLGTAVLAFLLLWPLGLPGAARWAFVLVLLCPMLLLCSCYALTESLSTFLLTLELFLALRAMRGPPIPNALLAGVVAGLAQLVRLDAFITALGVGLALWSIRPRPKRAAAGAVFVGAALLVYSPWPIRNLIRFGDAHPAACTWRAMDGTPLGDGMIEWARTWSSSAPGEAYFEVLVANHTPLDIRRPGVVQRAMYDDEVERGRLVGLFARYDREGFSPEVDEEFRVLARERTRRHPLRTFVELPLRRAAHLWGPMPEWELPMRVSWLGLPAGRPLFMVFDGLVYLLALIGGVLLVRRGHGRLVAIGAVCVVARTVLFSFAIPHVATKRYMVELFPLLLVLAAVALSRGSAGLIERRSTEGEEERRAAA